MTPPERFPPDDPREWLNRAKSNLAMAMNRTSDVYFRRTCALRPKAIFVAILVQGSVMT